MSVSVTAKSKRSVDIVIAAKNESSYIGQCLESLQKQVSKSYILRINIILVDNGSTDGTPAIAEEYIENIFYEPELSLAEVRNFGVAQGCGEYIAFIDADCTAEPNWLESAISCLEKGNVGAVGGPCDVPDGAALIERAWVVTPDVDLCLEVEELATSSFFIKREFFQLVGGFDSELGAGEDADISRRIREQVGVLLSTGRCRVIHYGYPKTLLEFIKREYWHGVWDARRTRGQSKILLASYGVVVALSILPVFVFYSFFIAAFVLFLGVFSFLVLLTLKKNRRRSFQPTLLENGMLMVLQVIYFFTRSCAGLYFMLNSAWPESE